MPASKSSSTNWRSAWWRDGTSKRVRACTVSRRAWQDGARARTSIDREPPMHGRMHIDMAVLQGLQDVMAEDYPGLLEAYLDDSEERLRSEEHTSELQSRPHLVCRLLLEKKKKK